MKILLDIVGILFFWIIFPLAYLTTKYSKKSREQAKKNNFNIRTAWKWYWKDIF